MWRDLAYPVAVLLFAITFLAASRVGILPSQGELLGQIESFVSSSSAIWITLIAGLEYTVAVNVYFPGSLVILAGMTATNGDFRLVTRMFTFILVGQAIGLLISYLTGWYTRRKVHKGVEVEGSRPSTRSAATLILATFLHPHSAALTSFNLGTRGCSVAVFVGWGILGLVVWGMVWTFACLHGLNLVIKTTPWDIAFVGYVTLWIIFVCVQHYRRRQTL